MKRTCSPQTTNKIHLKFYDTNIQNRIMNHKSQTFCSGYNSEMTQYGIQQRIKGYGQKDMGLLLIGTKQIDVHKCLQPIQGSSISKKDKIMTF
jgi:hypothetical protein